MDNSLSQEILRLSEVSLIDAQGFETILDSLSFTIHRGDRWGIMGPSGAGKTSLLRLLNRLVEPSQGSCFFEGKPFPEIPILNLRRKIVLIPQEPKLLGMTVQASLAYPLKLQQLKPEDIRTKIEQSCDRFQIPTAWLERNELQLSLGQRQLVTIVRAILMEPQILLLDEPTSALDGDRAESLLRELCQLNEQGMTMMMVNHQQHLIDRFTTQVLYLQAGKLVSVPGVN